MTLPDATATRWGRHLRAARYHARRIVQTPAAFENWPQVLRELLAGNLNRGPDELTFRTRTGLTISAPNRPGARVPVYEIFADDSYRLDWFLGPMRDEPIRCIDIGGHVGTFACRLAAANPAAHVQAYEPSPTTAGYLRRNVAQNGFAGRVEVFQKAMAATSATAMFADNGAGSGENGLLSVGASGPGVSVPTIAFDAAVAAAGEPVTLVKIDCEGGEYDLVLGSDAASWADVRRVVMEYHPVAGHHWEELRDYFGAVGLDEIAHERSDGYGCVWLSREPLAPARQG